VRPTKSARRLNEAVPSHMFPPWALCMTIGYAVCMAQLVTRVDDRLLAEIDALVTEGVAATRSDAVRLGLEALIEGHRRQRTGKAIVDGYRRYPQHDDELAGLNAGTRALVEEEPW
jgi:Arc/MetJ-type ribon-helix-helix transcriptional regulator